MSINEIFEEIWYRISDLQHIPYRLLRLSRKIIKIIKYIPLLWKDEDWDFEYILGILEHKLKNVRECIHKNDIISKIDQREIFIGINQTLEHIYNYRNSDKAYDEIYGTLPFETDIKFDKDETYHWCSHATIINNETGEELTPEEDKIYCDYITAKNNFEQKEWEAIFDTIKKEGQRWWE